jgi:L-amino acid N-acyltransferase YncA
VADGAIVATTALVRDGLGWSRHVAELRLLVAPAWRGKGLGRALLEASVRDAAADGADKIVAYMTPDQRGAITLFEECGFRAEALLRDHVRDAAGDAHDLVLLSLDIGKAQALGEAYR